MTNQRSPSFLVEGSDTPIPIHSPRLFWKYASAQWRRVFGLNISQIDDLLYVGGQFRRDQWPAMHMLGVRAVLSMQAENEDEFVSPLPARALRIPVIDFQPPSIEQLHQACAFIREAHAEGLPVFVHCHAGVGRAPLTAGAYLVSQGATAAQAIERIRRARPIIDLNLVQHARLVEWELRLRDTE
jgi:protein tyrosine phosphatase (PTP) superfamily phosphohydrolase (DUF442 family)